jgi:hypothetical protein
VAVTPAYASRFRDGLTDAETLLGYRPTRGSPLFFYAAGRYTQDSRSRGQDAIIFNDNALSVAPGIRFQPRSWSLSLSAELDYTKNLAYGPLRPARQQTDRRVVLADFRSWDSVLYGPLGLLALGLIRSERVFSEAGASVGYYSRYDDNVIAYLQCREGVRLWDNGAARLSSYWGVNAAKDSNHEFFNNLAEAAIGVEFEPFRVWNLHVRAEWVRGTYIPVRGGDPNPYGPHYGDFRAMTLYSQRFAIDPW